MTVHRTKPRYLSGLFAHTQALAACVAVVTIAGVPGVPPVSAGDFSHECRSASGDYEVSGGGLRATDRSGREPSSDIPYEVLRERVLIQREGYCVGTTGQQFGYSFRQSVQTLSIRRDGQALDIDVFCEIASSGLPAAETCLRDVLVLDDHLDDGAEPAHRIPRTTDFESTTSFWSYEGAKMRLLASGDTRAFVFETPTAAQDGLGVSRGVVLFDGVRKGQRYSGTAYAFYEGCDAQGFDVEGDVTADDTGVVLKGRAPRLDRDCNVTSQEASTLTLRFQSRP